MTPRDGEDYDLEALASKAAEAKAAAEKVAQQPPLAEGGAGAAAKPKRRPRAAGGVITEGSVAEAFTKEREGDLRFCHGSNCWYVWDATRWKREQTKLAYQWAHRKAKAMVAGNANAAAIISAGKASFAAGVERIAQSDRTFAVTQEIWDDDPWLLGTPDGTVNLKTGELRPAEAGDFITRLTGIGPAPRGTEHPLWTKFLDEATGGDGDYQAFLQRLSGYYLTGRVNEESLAFMFGVGGTGKGTLISTWFNILGDYAVSVPIEMFTAGTRLPLEYYRALMFGARLVTASETEQGATWSESQIKEMTGNETALSARHPHGRPFTYYPKFKINFVGNHAPRLKGRSRAMERRLRIAPFKHVPSEPDDSLKEKLRAEYPAILRWMIDGCLMWQMGGLGTCDAVAAETESYFEQQDVFGRWLDDRCTIGAGGEMKASGLLSDFQRWARESGEPPEMTTSDFKALLEGVQGVSYKTVHGNRAWHNIMLRPDTRERGYQPD